MQDITKEKCDSMPTGIEGRLIDNRDGKIYWVAKLKNRADDNALCWMTQNLDYDNYGVAATSFTNGTQNTAQYYDPGEYVYTLISEASWCRSNPNLNIGFSGCVEQGWTNVSNMLASTNPAMLDTVIYDDGLGYIYDAHYLVGNYYNWMAATNGSTIDSGDADTSICPTGWSLPLAGSNNNSNDGSFYKLMNGLKNTDITVAPYYFVYGGFMSSYFENVGAAGSYWSSTAPSSIYNDAYRLFFSSSEINLSNSYYRWFGMTVRCVAR